MQVTPAHEQQALDGGHAFVSDGRHQLAVRADDGVDARLGEPSNAGAIRPDPGEQVEVGGDELPRSVDTARNRADLEAVAPQDEQDLRPRRDRLVQLLVVGDRGTARRVAEAGQKLPGIRW